MKTNSYILGISYGTHDTSACLLKDGKVLAGSEEERFIRKKRTENFPTNAITFCLREANIHPGQINIVAVPVDLNVYISNIFYIYNRKEKNSSDQIQYILKNFEKLIFIRETFKQNGISLHPDVEIVYYNHHLAHAASSYYASGFNSAAIIVIDGVGEMDTISVFDGCDGNIIRKYTIKYPYSLGKLYGSICRYLGFWGPSKEGKVMGLSSYEEPVYWNDFKKMLIWNDKGFPEIDLSYFDYGLCPLQPSFVSKKFIKSYGKPKKENELITDHHRKIASSLQALYEYAFVRIAEKTIELTGRDKLCLAGGTMLNCQANSALRNKKIYKSIYIPPFPHDSGLSLGSAFLAFYDFNNKKVVPCKLESPFIGPSYSTDDILSAARTYNLSYKLLEEPYKVSAKMISKGEIVGWFQGRMEYGPRALGNRSIIADPRNPDTKNILNKLIKKRESFRPFAPAILAEAVTEIFRFSKESPFMTEVFMVHPDWEAKIPAVVHVDKTSRVQTVTKSSNKLFYSLIMEFYKLTGVPLVLNTSFNGRDEPIVNAPIDAITTFQNTGLKKMIIENYLFKKND